MYVSGSATTEKMTAYSVSTTGSTPVITIASASTSSTSQVSCEARCAGGLAVAAPLPAAELRKVVGTREDRVDRGAADGEQDPDQREQQSDLSERILGAEGDRAEMLGRDSVAEKQRGADDHQREGEEAAEAVPDDRVRAIETEVFRRPLLLDSARGIEVDLVGRHRRSEQPDREVRVEQLVVGATCGTSPLPTLPQSGPSFTAATAKTSMQSPP